MSRPKSPPSYCVHSRSGRAYTTVDGRQVQLGKADSPESLAAFDRLLSQWYGNGRSLPAAPVAPDGCDPRLTLAMMLERFWTHAEGYYTRPVRDADGNPILNPDGTAKREPTEQLDHFRAALSPLLRMYGTLKAADFGCPELEAVREWMIRPHCAAS